MSTDSSISQSSPQKIHKGLEGVTVSETRLSNVDGTRCQLSYRGYGLDELVGKTSYEEVAFLLLFGHLPTRQELTEWTQQLISRRALDPEVLRLMQLLPLVNPAPRPDDRGLGEAPGGTMPPSSPPSLTRLPWGGVNPMAYLRTIVSVMGLLDATAERIDPATLQQQAVDLIAKTPTIIATFERLRHKRAMLGPRPDLGHAANFLYMLHGEEPDGKAVAALDAYFVMLAEHGFNASTFAARTTVATQSDLYSGIVAAIATLKGPLHGAANAKAMEMLMEIGSPDKVAAYVQKTLSDHKRFMGFGHRVYKGEDPRAKHLKRFTQELARANGDLRWFEISQQLQEAVWKAKQLSINVDFYSASLLYYLGIPVDLFTTLFACSRMAGWTAHILEQLADNRLIRPLALYVGPTDLRFVPIEQRTSPTVNASAHST